MSYKKSTLDQISDSIAKEIRKLSDIQNDLVGTKCSVLRIKEESMDMMGDKTFSYQSDVIDNVIIRYPFSTVEIISTNDTGSLDNTALDLFDLLPINMKVPFDDDVVQTIILSGEAVNPIEIDKNDLIVDLLYDSNLNPVPLIMQVSRIFGGFLGRNQTSRRYELTLQRGEMETEIQDIIDIYISGEASPI